MALILRAIRFEEACDPPCFKTLFLGKSEFFDRHLDDCKARFGGERIEGLVCRLILTAFRIIFDEACADLAVVISGCAKGRERRSEEHTSELQSLMRNPYAVYRLQHKKSIKT